MAFNDEQIVALSSDLDRRHVRTRRRAGRELSYIEGWQAISEANTIFGFDGWASETVDLRCVAEKKRQIGHTNPRPGYGVSYIAKVRITVYAGDTLITREGVGSGHGIDADLGLAHESAVKEAETDARKRALMTFGNPFGLALYDKEQAHVSNTDQKAKPAQNEPPAQLSNAAADMLADLETYSDIEELKAWRVRMDSAIVELLPNEFDAVKKAYQFTFKVLKAGEEKAA
jgi:DNA repair and recombination protein RAD52